MQRCLGCMREFDNKYELCPYCGYIVGTEPEQKNHLQGGTVLADRYIVGKVLGYGGFGITYIAWDNRLQRSVAIKEFFPNALSTRNQGETAVSCYNEKSARYFNDGVRKMLDEGKRLSKFHRNANIVDVYDFFEENNTAYIVMEYLEGCDLKKHLEENGRMNPEEAVNIIIPVLNALSDMHGENLIHRDVSPDNIYLCDNGVVKLLDFGSARLAVQDAEKSISVMVKHGYAPKEQYASRSKQGPWTDVYAVCATLYKMITGELPAESIERETEPLKSFEHYGIAGCFALEKVIAHGLEPEIQNRIKSASELKNKLENLSKEDEKEIVNEDSRIDSDNDNIKEKNSKFRIIGLPIVISAIVIVICAISYLYLFEGLFEKEAKIVPDFIEMNYWMEIDGNPMYDYLDINIKEISNSEVGEGVVFYQTPGGGTKLKGKEKKVFLLVSRTEKYYKEKKLPNVAGKNYIEAKKELVESGFTVVCYPIHDSATPKNNVVYMDPLPTDTVSESTVIKLYYSSEKINNLYKQIILKEE